MRHRLLKSVLYASHADLKLSESEEEAMRNRLDSEHYEAVKGIFNNSSDYEIIQIILSYKGLYFPTLSRTEELLDMLKKQFFADGEYSTLEKNTFRLLKKLL